MAASTGSFTIRPFEPVDEPAVIALWAACGLTRPWNDPAKDIARKRTVQPELFVVGLHNDDLVATAMAGYDGHRGWINYLAVDPAQRRRGFALALLREVEAGLAALGCPKLNLQIRSTNGAAIGFYRAIGYLPDDAVCYGKRLIDDLPTDPSTAP